MNKLKSNILFTILFIFAGLVLNAQQLKNLAPELSFVNSKGEKIITHKGNEAILIEAVLKDKSAAQSAARSMQVIVLSETEMMGEIVELKESAANSGIFKGSITVNENAAPANNNKLEVKAGDRISAVYSNDPQSNTAPDASYEMWYKGPEWSFENTGKSHIVLIPNYASVTIDGQKIQPGDFISVFYDKKVGDRTQQLNAGGMGLGIAPGGVKYTGNVTAIAIWGTQDGKNNGLAVGETLKWKIWRAKDGKVFDAEATYMTEVMDPSIVNTDTYVVDGISGIMSLTAKSK